MRPEAVESTSKRMDLTKSTINYTNQLRIRRLNWLVEFPVPATDCASQRPRLTPQRLVGETGTTRCEMCHVSTRTAADFAAHEACGLKGMQPYLQPI